jgi:putative zinc finger/helix-turn-helix YgiT family protein
MKLEIGKQCPICQKGAFELYIENVELSYKDDIACVHNVELYKCNYCSENFYSKESERKMDKVFADLRRKKEGLLTSDELTAIRSKNNLSQEQLSQLLGMDPKTLAQYEAGTIIQSRSTDIFLRLIRDNPSNLNYLLNYSIRMENSLENTKQT